MAKLKPIKIKFLAINVIKEKFPGISERSIYNYLAGRHDIQLCKPELRERILSVRKFAKQFERINN